MVKILRKSSRLSVGLFKTYPITPLQRSNAVKKADHHSSLQYHDGALRLQNLHFAQCGQNLA